MDNNDGHVRRTSGPDFRLHSCSALTHTRMQTKAMEFMRLVDSRGLSMESISRRECREILAEIGMREEKTAAN